MLKTFIVEFLISFYNEKTDNDDYSFFLDINHITGSYNSQDQAGLFLHLFFIVYVSENMFLIIFSIILIFFYYYAIFFTLI